MEIGPAERVFSGPHHPYTESLLAAAAQTDSEGTRRLHGEIPSAMNPPSGCVFRTRCPHAISKCAEVRPPLESVAAGRYSACIRKELFEEVSPA